MEKKKRPEAKDNVSKSFGESEGGKSMSPPPFQLKAGKPGETGKTSGTTPKADKDFTPDHDATDFSKKSEKKKLAKSSKEAFKMVTKAQKNVSKDNKKYKKWMDAGKTDTGNADKRLKHVKLGLDAIHDVLKNDQIIFKQYGLSDGEEDETYAYVQPSEKDHNIYLGGAFWVANTKGWNSKAGTIIHELSHRVHGTDDHAYGKADAKEFAKSDPDSATTNADNYEYFAEGA